MERKLLKELKVVQKQQQKLTKKDHSESEDSEMDSDSSNWPLPAMEHGGKAGPFYLSDDSSDNSIVTNYSKTQLNEEINVFDKLIGNDVENIYLVDDISVPERAGDQKQGIDKKCIPQKNLPPSH